MVSGIVTALFNPDRTGFHDERKPGKSQDNKAIPAGYDKAHCRFRIGDLDANILKKDDPVTFVFQPVNSGIKVTC